MLLRWYLIIMVLATTVCWSAFFFVTWTVNPETTNWIGFLLFYTSLFFSMVGTASIVGFVIRFVALRNELVFSSVKDAFRQSFLFSFFIAAILYLLSKDLFSWLNLFLLIIGLSILEFFILSYYKTSIDKDIIERKYVKSEDAVNEKDDYY